MNAFLEIQIKNMLLSLQNFESGCELAVKKDDGVIDRDERRKLNKILAATEQYKKELGKICR